MDQNRQQQLDEPLAELDNPRWTRARVVERSGAVLIVDGYGIHDRRGGA